MAVIINEFEAVAEAPQSGQAMASAATKAPPPHAIRRDLRAAAWRAARVNPR